MPELPCLALWYNLFRPKSQPHDWSLLPTKLCWKGGILLANAYKDIKNTIININ